MVRIFRLLTIVISCALAPAGIFFGGGCSKSNATLCCVSEADCLAVGIPSGSSCGAGLGCIDHSCVTAQCSVDTDCPAATPHCGEGVCRECTESGQCDDTAPVCNVNTFACDNCAGPQDCATFVGQNQCAATGACVECLTGAQCSAAEPVCGANGNCRVCEHDAECASGACDIDGTCVDPAKVVYVSNTGVDGGNCVQTQPCQSVAFAVGKVASTRTHISMAKGTYDEPLNANGKPRVQFHGNESTVKATSGSAIPSNGANIFASDVKLTGVGASALSCLNNGVVVLRSVDVIEDTAISNFNACRLTWTLSNIKKFQGLRFDTNSQAVLKRLTITDGEKFVDATNSIVNAENLLISNHKQGLFRLVDATGTISHITYANPIPAPEKRFDCLRSPVKVTSSIFWSPAQEIVFSGNCVFGADSIAGPTVNGGLPLPTTNVDPMFVDEVNGNYHLKPGSPAVDKSDIGPAIDLDGNPRPRGVKFDLGAYEVQ
jgi:hypothetical protein